MIGLLISSRVLTTLSKADFSVPGIEMSSLLLRQGTVNARTGMPPFATTSQKVFPDYDAYLSRYSYLVSLFPGENYSEFVIEAAQTRNRLVHALSERWPASPSALEQRLGRFDVRADREPQVPIR